MEVIKEYFKKDIEREIKAVVKVDDELNIKQELEEYIVTNELLKHFNSIFSAFENEINNNSKKIGVWITGFFGSGKSHFLKILSYLLENKIVGDKYAVEYFNDKISDQMLLATMKKIGTISSDVILFDVDTKAGQKKNEKARLVDIFEKVFNERVGLSTSPYVAEIERTMIKQNKYEEFVTEFNNTGNSSWEDARDGLQFVADRFVTAYSKVMNSSKEEARDVINITERNYSLDIKTFAQRVREYIESKGNDHHVYFLVDEIGQYIAGNRNLILNLQSIEQELETECGGKAWIIVTSQEAIDDVVKVVGNDYSKILARFDTLLNFSSSDIEEVIKRRLLEKKENYKKSLELLYEKDESTINNLLTFNDTAYKKKYKNKLDFAETYPFIPYQFTLLQKVFENIRNQGYAGKSISSGERSLLGAVQMTTINYMNEGQGTLIPFYAFYDTISKHLESKIHKVIKAANDAVEGGKLEPNDVKVLKMLFMLKNVKEIKANIDNLATLYVSNIQDDKISIKKEITEALKRLEGQTLIQRNNEEYKFLTDEEQEINRAIKRITIGQNKITEYIEKIVYTGIYSDTKYMYKRKIFNITKYIDDTKFTKDYESSIGLKVITLPDVDIALESSLENKYVYVKLEIPTLLHNEIENCLQFKVYDRDNTYGVEQTKEVNEILTIKRDEIAKAENAIANNIKEKLDIADIFIAGDKQKINHKEAKARINEALEILVNNVYSKINYINKNYTIQDIRDLWDSGDAITLDNEVDFTNQKALDSMKDYIEREKAYNRTITIKTLLDDFEKAPYGFSSDDILYLLVKLLKDEVVSIYYSNEIQNITSENTLNKILKREYHDKTEIRIRKKVDIKYINDMKSVAMNSFSEFGLRDNEDGMIEDFKERCIERSLEKLKDILGYYNNIKDYQYPGKDIVENAIRLYTSIKQKNDILEIFEEVSNKKEEINELASKIDVISKFFYGTQKVAFDQMRETLVIYDNNKHYVEYQSKELQEKLQSTLSKILDIVKNEEPYDLIHELPILQTEFKNILAEMYEASSEPIIEMANSILIDMEDKLKAEELNIDSFSKNYIINCKEIIKSLQSSKELKDIYAQEAVLRQMNDLFIVELDNKRIEKIEKLAENASEVVEIKNRKTIRIDNLMKRSYEISSREDIDKYIEELKNKLVKELEENSSLTIQ